MVILIDQVHSEWYGHTHLWLVMLIECLLHDRHISKCLMDKPITLHKHGGGVIFQYLLHERTDVFSI